MWPGAVRNRVSVLFKALVGQGGGPLEKGLRGALREIDDGEHLSHQTGSTFRREARKAVTTRGADSWGATYKFTTGAKTRLLDSKLAQVF